jgi:large subunit ribosomal protein L29
MSETNPIKSMSDEQLAQSIGSRERELVEARFGHSMQQLENTASLTRIRKDIARMQTEARAREIVQGLAKGQLVAKHQKTAAAKTDATAPQAPAEKGGFLKGIVDRLTGKE